MSSAQTVLVTGGAGYIGGILIPKLLSKGYRVKVLDLYLFGNPVWGTLKNHPQLEEYKGDIRNQKLLHKVIPGCTSVIHLACISNDPSFELDPKLSKSINYDAFNPLVTISKECGVRKFIYASSSSVYGISKVANVTEDHPLVPLTDYSRYKCLCEPLLLEEETNDFIPVVLRPATVCGYSPRQRLDLTVNILTNHAVNTHKIIVFGGMQMRPNIHIEDMTDLYCRLLELPEKKITGKIYNVGYQNHTVFELAKIVKKAVERKMTKKSRIKVETIPTNDTRSYHISSEKITQELSFRPKRTVENAVQDLVAAFRTGKLPNSMTDPRYFNLKMMQQLHLN